MLRDLESRCSRRRAGTAGGSCCRLRVLPDIRLPGRGRGMSLRSSVPDSHNAASVAAKIAQEAMETAQAASSGAHHSGGRASLSDRCAALIIVGFVALILMLRSEEHPSVLQSLMSIPYAVL